MERKEGEGGGGGREGRGGIFLNKTTNLSVLILLYHPSQNMMDVAMAHLYS